MLIKRKDQFEIFSSLKQFSVARKVVSEILFYLFDLGNAIEILVSQLVNFYEYHSLIIDF